MSDQMSGLDHEKFVQDGYRPCTPFTPDQVAYLEDKFTSLMTWFAYEENASRKLKNRMAEALKEIKEMSCHEKDGNPD